MRSDKIIKISRFLLGLLLTMLIIGGCNTSTSPGSSTLYDPGIYMAESRGLMGRITVEVTFSEDSIINITLIECHESVDMFEEVAYAVTSIPAAIVDRQTLLVDAVSGATYASNAILKAVEACVKQAGGDEAVAKLKETGAAKFIDLYSGR
jgi:fumarate reductase flavoprotein subunit